MTEISVRAAGGAKALPLPGRNIKEVKNMTVKEAVILAAEELGVGFIPGVEISTGWGGRVVHIVG